MASRIKTWVEVKDGGAELVLDRQNEERKNGTVGKKNLGIIIDTLLNEYAQLIKKKK